MIEESKTSSIDKNTVIMTQINDQFIEIGENESIWICEFCNQQNRLIIELEEIPQQDDVIYLIQSAQQIRDGKQQNQQQGQSVIFCIDVSGSMSSTTEVKGQINLKHGLSVEEYEMLKQFIDPGDEQQILPGQQGKQITYVSRKQCVLAAIEQQVNDMAKNQPNKLVGLVTFNNEVTLFGDGSIQPVIIAGDFLQKAEEIRNKTINQQLLTVNVQQSSQLLIERFQKIKEGGQTALGPALLSALQLAKQGQAGSLIVICTDGLANLGLGALDQQNDEITRQFYANIGVEAKQLGIAISIITIKGEGCRMDILSQLAEQTNGNVTRVDPDQIGNDFANILKDEIVGMQVGLKVQMHRALKFRNENQGISQDGTLLDKNIGNATINTQVTFEYELKNEEELQQYNIDVKDLKYVPFQARIVYTSLDGDKYLRVLSKQVKTTEDLVQAEKEAEVTVIHKRIQQQTAQHVRNHSFSKAQEYNCQWDDYIQNNTEMNKISKNCIQNQQFKEVSKKLQKVTMKCEKREINKEKKLEKIEKKIPEQKKLGFLDQIMMKFSSRDQVQNKRKNSVDSMQSRSESDEDMEQAELYQFQK